MTRRGYKETPLLGGDCRGEAWEARLGALVSLCSWEVNVPGDHWETRVSGGRVRLEVGTGDAQRLPLQLSCLMEKLSQLAVVEVWQHGQRPGHGGCKSAWRNTFCLRPRTNQQGLRATDPDDAGGGAQVASGRRTLAPARPARPSAVGAHDVLTPTLRGATPLLQRVNSATCPKDSRRTNDPAVLCLVPRQQLTPKVSSAARPSGVSAARHVSAPAVRVRTTLTCSRRFHAPRPTAFRMLPSPLTTWSQVPR